MNTQLNIDIRLANAQALKAIRSMRTDMARLRKEVANFNRTGNSTILVLDAMTTGLVNATQAMKFFIRTSVPLAVMSKNMSALGKSMRTVNRSLTPVVATSKAGAKSMATFNAVMGSSTKNAAAASGSFKSMSASLAALTASYKVASAAAKKFGTTISSARSISTLGASASSAIAPIKRLSGSLNRLSQTMISVGRDGQWLARQLEFRIALPIIALGGISIKMAKDVNEAMTRVRKVYNVTGAQGERDLAQLEQAFSGISDALGVHQDEVVKIGAVWAQAGEEGAELAARTLLTIQTAILGGLEYEKSAKSIITVQKAFRFSTEELTEGIAILNRIENETAVNMGDLITGIEEAGNVAVTSGLSIAELGSLISVLVPVTGPAGEVGNSLKSLILRFGAPTGAAAESIRQLTTAMDDGRWSTLNFAEQITELTAGYTRLDKAAKLRFVRETAQLRQSDKALALLRDLASGESQYFDILQKVNSGTLTGRNLEVFQEELAEFLDSDAQRFEIAINRIRNSFIAIGADLLPVLVNILEVVALMTDEFGKLSPETKKFIAAILVFLALAPPLAAFLFSIAILIGALIKGFLFLLVPLKLAFGLFVLLKGAFLGFVGVAALLVKSVSAIGTVLSASVTFIGSTLGGIGALVGGTFASVSGTIAAAAPLITAAITVLGVAIKVALVAALATAVVVAFAALSNTVGAAWEGVRARLFSVISQLPDDIAGVLMSLIDSLASMAGLASEILLAIPRIIADAFGKGVELAAVRLEQLPQIVWNVFKAIIQILIKVGKAINQLIQAINPFNRNSPSLVDNVIKGTGIIADKYDEMAVKVKRSLSSASTPLIAFAKFVKQARMEKQKLEQQSNRELISEIRPTALASYAVAAELLGRLTIRADALTKRIDRVTEAMEALEAISDSIKIELDFENDVLTTLRDDLREISDLLRDAESNLSSFSEIRITGQIEAEDEIFGLRASITELNLELAQFELAALQAASTTGTLRNQQVALGIAIDQAEAALTPMTRTLGVMDRNVRIASDSLSILETTAGRIEDAMRDARAAVDELTNTNLTGERQADDQIFNLGIERKQVELELRKLEQAFGSVEDAPANVAAAMNQLRDEMDSIDLQRDILSLETEINFDPLRRAISDAADPISEMDFDDIITGVFDQQQLISDQEAAFAAVNSQIDEQSDLLDALTASRDAYARVIDDERNMIEDMQNSYEDLGDAIASADSERNASIDSITRQIELLSKMADVADLQMRVTFGPMEEIIDKLLNPQTSADFSSIVDGIAAQTTVVAELTQEYDNAANAVGVQVERVDELQAAYDRANVAVATQRLILDDLGDTYDAVTARITDQESAIDDFLSSLRDIQTAAEQAFGGVSAAGTEAIADIAAEFDALGDEGFFGNAASDELLVNPEKTGLDKWLDDFNKEVDKFGEDAKEKVREVAKDISNAFWDGIRDKEVAGKSLEEWVQAFEDNLPLIETKIDNFILKIENARDSVQDFTDSASEKLEAFKNSQFWQDITFSINTIKTEFDRWGGVSSIIDKISEKLAPLKLLFGIIGLVIAKLATDMAKTFRNVSKAFGFVSRNIFKLRNWLADLTGKDLVEFAKSIANFGQSFGSLFSGDTWANALRRGINGAITVLNTFIGLLDSLFRRIGLPSINFRIDYIAAPSRAINTRSGPQYAQGGNLPTSTVGQGFTTDGARAIVGEGNRSYREFVVPTDPKYRSNAMRLFAGLAGDLGVPGFLHGGILPDNFNEILNKAIGVGKSLNPISLAKKIAKSANSQMSRISIPSFPSGVAGDMGRFGANSLKSGAADIVGDAISGMSVTDMIATVSRMGLSEGGIAKRRPGGYNVTVGEGRTDEGIFPLPPGFNITDVGATTNVFNGDLIFPNVTNETGAKKLIDDLEAMV